jgi:hypothetical protein
MDGDTVRGLEEEDVDGVPFVMPHADTEEVVADELNTERVVDEYFVAPASLVGLAAAEE